MPLPLPPGLSRNKKTDRPAAVSGDEAAVQLARTRARQRLVGALVLLGVGVLVFPLVFETAPRPLATDTPIRLAQRDGGTVQPAPTAGAVAPAASLPAAAPSAVPAAPERTLPPPDAGIEQAAPASAPAATQAVPPQPRPSAPAVPAPAALPPAAKPAATAASRPASAAASAPVAARFIVQAGAYVDARSLREARSKVEAMGLKTYTQVVETDGGKRTRVRVGPFDTRAEAEAAAARIRSGGLAANVLTL